MASIPFNAGDGGFAQFRIPSLALTSAGVLVALCEGRWKPGDAGDINIVSRRSTDGGRTWSPLREVLSHGHDTAGNPAVVTDPASGDLVLLSCRNRGGDTWSEITSGAAPARRVYVQRSADDGATWSAPAEITGQVRADWMRWYATGPGHGVAIAAGPHAGRLVIPCNHTRAGTGAHPKYSGGHCVYSDDGGRTWTLGFTSSNPNNEINEDEATVTLLADGQTLYFNCRCASDRQPGNRADAISRDGGRTLERPYRPQTTISGAICQGSVITLGDGRLLYSGPSHPSPDASGRAAMALRVSEDDGRTWRTGYEVSGLPAAYSAMVLLDAATVGLLYETGDWTPDSRIAFEAIPVAALEG
ncbi:hypothetical protein Misp01_76760 [Microtetraspora sp. NBRC 13810]|uniref:sialidase family protein n=1 Tax=Microtetraspora sp. NBRC 13810 TaxID=3030990 RepID=UPI0024A0EAAA|nr:sialidase family protein [Microtetraspora sp. NBRC 13810]GLW12548.1 hypothetical protein Misp01_76760 [Microtetraspora sp. NBRC 13810]